MFTPNPIFVLPVLLFSIPYVLASPISAATTPYQVTSYRSSCSPAGCIYNFDISFTILSDSSSNEPAFDTTCRGTNMQNTMKACTDGTVTAAQSSGESEVVLVVMHSECCLSFVCFFSCDGLSGVSKIVRVEMEVMTEKSNGIETSG
ncbi:phosphoinositide phosphatase Pten Tep1 protein [Rutstroemia sp. NJR-2017a BVV2]|nr:phosphoinositide phosphatase Pten Tep1 protein [Rutstroemia sp. NJR-2017a BVV2]